MKRHIRNIKDLLEIQDRRGTWLAAKCGITPQLVHYWLTEKHAIKEKYRERIASAFQVPESLIWEGDIIHEPNPTKRAVKKAAAGMELTSIEKGLITKTRNLK